MLFHQRNCSVAATAPCARAQFRAALAALDADGDEGDEQCRRWCAIAQKLGMASVFDPIDLAEGTALFERAVAKARELGDAAVMARCEYWLGYVAYAVGKTAMAMPHCEAALALAEHIGDARLAAQVRATLAQALIAAGRYERAAPLVDLALDSKKHRARPGSSVAIGSAYALAAKGPMLGDQGHFLLADDCFAEALALLGDSPHQVGSSVRGLIAATWLWQSRWADARRIADEGARIAELGRRDAEAMIELGVLVAFVGGVLSFASPCCLPLVPAYVGTWSGRRATDRAPADGASSTALPSRPASRPSSWRSGPRSASSATSSPTT